MDIAITDDNIVEGNETFSMSLNVPSSLGPGITTGGNASANATIIDTTSKCHIILINTSYLCMYAI